MKKTILTISAVSLLLAGCLSKEQNQRIKSFWFGQYMSVMTKLLSSAASKGMMMPGTPLVTPTDMPAATAVQSVSPAPEILDVTLEAETLPGPASYEDRVRMKQDITALQENNQIVLQDLQTTFGSNVKEKAFYIMLDTEAKLKQQASQAPDYNTYSTYQQKLLAEQENALNRLMQQNKTKLRRIKK